MVAQVCLTSEKDCYAKLNLSLRVWGRRDDGFHELRTIMVPVSLADRLRGVTRRDGKITLKLTHVHSQHQLADRKQPAATLDPESSEVNQTAIDVAEVPSDHRNLIVAVAAEFQRVTGASAGVDFTLLKRIPAGGGLGGASSNAAAALEILNQIWGIDWPRARLAEFSAGFGSDIPFFFSHSAAIAEGRGERITPVPMLANVWMVVIRPPFALSTPSVFSELNASALTDARQPSLQREIESTPILNLTSSRWVHSSHCLENDLTAPAKRLQPGLETLERAICLTNPLGLTMSGSGSCFFAVYRNRKSANIAAVRLRGQRAGQTFVVRPALRNWMVNKPRVTYETNI